LYTTCLDQSTVAPIADLKYYYLCPAVDEEGKRPKRYFPFAEGPRNCVGQSLAQVTLPVTLAILLSRFHFKLAEEVRLVLPFAPKTD
jgi:cytochrome P450